MRITNVEAVPVSRGAQGSGHATFLFVVVDTDEGISGVGEAGLTGRELAVMGVIDHLRPLLVDQDPMRTEHLWQVMSRGGFFPAQRVIGAAISAIDIALWDIKGKALGVPVATLLGGHVRDRVVCYPHNNGHRADVDSLVASCQASVAEGWKFVRWGLPDGDGVMEPRRMVRLAIEQVAAVRAAVGPDIELCLDVHTRVDPSDAVRLCREIERYDPYFVEDPLRAENTASYRMLRQRTAVPIAAGEHASTKWEVRELIEEELIDHARIDLCLVGGFTEARKIAGWCETHHIRVSVHNPLGPVATAACLQFNLATPNVGVQEQPARPGTTLPDVITGQPEWADGYLLPPDRPGLGIGFDREAARNYPFVPRDLPRLVREDGSFTNW